MTETALQRVAVDEVDLEAVRRAWASAVPVPSPAEGAVAHPGDVEDVDLERLRGESGPDPADFTEGAAGRLTRLRDRLPELLRDADESAASRLAEVARAHHTHLAQVRIPRAPVSRAPVQRLDLGPGKAVFPPPYDVAEDTPKHGRPVSTAVDADLGTLTVSAPHDRESHGLRIASASIGLCLKPNREGTLVVGPFARYAGDWSMWAAHLSAHTEARLTLTAVTDPQGDEVDRRDRELWNMTTKSDLHYDSPDDWLMTPDPDFQLRFPVDPGQRYVVLLGATVSGDQSGPSPMPFTVSGSYFNAEVTLKTLWFEVELRS